MSERGPRRVRVHGVRRGVGGDGYPVSDYYGRTLGRVVPVHRPMTQDGTDWQARDLDGNDVGDTERTRAAAAQKLAR